jgi:predicted Zn-dependent peptidase
VIATINRTEVDGIHTLWVDVPGPMMAILSFRVGRADEHLARSGVTHLLEHLALHPFGGDPDHSGFVDAVRTVFHASGSPEEVTEFLNRLGSNLESLSSDRLEVEKQVLRAEAAGRPATVHDSLARRRYGAATYGLVGYRELGLTPLTGAHVAEWSSRHLTAGNAGLALSGPPPAGLRIELPPGILNAPPAPSSALPATPAWYPDNVDGPAVGLVVPRRPASQALASLLAARLRSALRFEKGISYSPSTGYERRDGTHAHLFAAADALAENHDAVLRGLLGVLKDLATSGVTDDELEEAKATFRGQLDDPRVPFHFADAAVFEVLMGLEPRPADAVVDEWMALTNDEVRAVTAAGLETALACVPHGLSMPPDWHRAPEWSDDLVKGRSRSWTGRNPTPAQLATDLVVGDEGVSLTDGTHHVTVRFQDTAAALAWADGRRLLIGLDGTTLTVEPNLWQRPGTAAAEIDRHIPGDRVIRLPDREPAEIPKRPRLPSWLPTAIAIVGYAVAAAVLLFGPWDDRGRLPGPFASLLTVAFIIATWFGVAQLIRFVNRTRHRRAQARGSSPT